MKLGPEDAVPDYSYTSWFAMLFSAGMGIGLMFFGVAEPVMHFTNPPVGEAGTVQAARDAMVRTFSHWACTPGRSTWGWWISWSPFGGMFIARVSRGRTIREFIAGVMLVPPGFTFLWLTVFGNTALSLAMEGAATDIVATVQANLPVALFSLLEQLPLPSLTALVAVTRWRCSSSPPRTPVHW